MKKDINDELQNKNIIRVLEHNFYDVSEIEMLFFQIRKLLIKRYFGVKLKKRLIWTAILGPNFQFDRVMFVISEKK